ncbi:MAG: APC family permease [Xanthobacteraceae bacterium]
MNSASVARPDAGHDPTAASPGGLKKDALSFAANVVIAVASTAPAYSLAAALPALVAAAKFGVPAILIVAFIPMLFVAIAYYHLNRADPDCGTTFSWTTRALGPYAGWMGGWAIIATDILVMPSLAQIAGQYSFRLFGVLQPPAIAVTGVGVAWIVIMTAICYYGIELSARTQKFLLLAEVVLLVAFAAVALAKVYAGGVAGAHPVSLGWFNPLRFNSGGDFTQAFLLAVFIYWGWDTGASVNEETINPATAPGRSAILSTVLLVGLYVLVSVAATAFAEPALGRASAGCNGDFLAPLITGVLGPWGKLLVFTVLTSAAACTQTTILPTARTIISMARAGALPKKFADIHPRFLTPGVATLAMGAVSIVWYLALTAISSNVLADSATATAIGIAFYYGLTGFACVAFYRRDLRSSLRNAIFLGLVPAAGGLIMLGLFIAACIVYSKPEQSCTSLAGIGGALMFGVGVLALGLVLMLLARLALPEFFKRKPRSHSRLVSAPDSPSRESAAGSR